MKADVELVRKVFSKFDINSDGRIEAKELKTAMKELIGKEASDEEIAEMVFNKKSKYIYLRFAILLIEHIEYKIKAADLNLDGVIDFGEFLAILGNSY